MPDNRSKKEKFKGLIQSMLSPTRMMEGRGMKLKTMDEKNMGGMFDIIYKKRKERERALGQIEY